MVSTPFDAEGECDTEGIRCLIRYVAEAEAHGAVYPAIASEFATLSVNERQSLTEIALHESHRHGLPLIVGISAGTVAESRELAMQAATGGAAAVMLMAPRSVGSEAGAVADFFAVVAETAADLPVVMQNAPPPLGSALPVEVVRAVVERVPKIRYIKEENTPCGQRISSLLDRAPTTLLGVMGGAGGRFVLDEYARGACGSMPACELVEAHVAIWDAVQSGQHRQARALFNRILPLLNLAAVYRQEVVKRVLKYRGLIRCDRLRDTSLPMDDYDRAEVHAVARDLEDLMTVRLEQTRIDTP